MKPRIVLPLFYSKTKTEETYDRYGIVDCISLHIDNIPMPAKPIRKLDSLLIMSYLP